ncbi:MAG: hypothetical protein HZA51_08535 [Planctomycetes bacterium]|nr:hypothetical protein [Planctomycetota bacterium]
MGFLKSKWRLLVFVLVCLGSLGMGGWAYMSSGEVTEAVQKLVKLKGDVESAANIKANARIIEARKKQVEQANADFERAMNSALALQKLNAYYDEVGPDGKVVRKPRDLLIDKVLPKPTKAQAINFKDAYSKAFDELKDRLKGRDKPTNEEVRREQDLIKGSRGGPSNIDLGPWGPSETTSTKTKKDRTLAEVLKESGKAMAADKVARSVRMYVNPNALARQAKVLAADVPSDIEIWQAQMSLWIQQDFVTILAKMNEERAAELEKAGKTDQLWVAYMPVKHLVRFGIDAKLGKGGGSNPPKAWAPSFTNINNDDKLFKVPLQLEVVIEEAALIDLLDRITKAGFYTPINLNYDAVKPNPLIEDYIYGEQPVVKVLIDIEAFYFRQVFEQWIPEKLKKILKTANAADDGKP